MVLSESSLVVLYIYQSPYCQFAINSLPIYSMTFISSSLSIRTKTHSPFQHAKCKFLCSILLAVLRHGLRSASVLSHFIKRTNGSA
jgi:hypothetical protein